MKLEIKPNQWSCLATSFSMALGIPTSVFYEIAGHDGGKILWGWLPEPQCRRGFHISEAVFVAMMANHSATPFELFPVIGPSRSSEMPKWMGPSDHKVLYGNYALASDETNWSIFEGLIHNHTGVIEARTRSGNWHAVAFEKGNIFDPDGREYPYTREGCQARGLFTTRLWRVEKVK
jgi:hypothetical protein